MQEGAIIYQPVALGCPMVLSPGTQSFTEASFPVGVPYGLVHLLAVCELNIRQRFELLEVLCGCELQNKYEIYSTDGMLLYKALEDSDCLSRHCFGNLRPFEMILRDLNGTVAMQLSRPLSCQGPCCPCAQQSISVYSPPGILTGTVEEQHECNPDFVVKNNLGVPIFKIVGPFNTVSFTCGNVDFSIISASTDIEIGKITKLWTGCGRESLTDMDSFTLKFPLDLEVGMKAVLIGATFLIDFMYYERNQN